MLDASFFSKLRDKFNYDDKTMKALYMIVPALIEYYGKDYEEIILSSIYDCEIIPCNSHDTISKVLNKHKLTPLVGGTMVSDVDLKRSESVYCPNVKVSYDKDSNKYNIDKTDRVIITSHTYNYDSLKGIEILTHALCHLVKSYNNEFEIEENVLNIRNGIGYEKRKIIYGDDISLELMEEYGKGFEEGLTLYDTEKIVSLICKDNYIIYDFNSIYTVAYILKDRFKLKDEINEYELAGDSSSFRNKYGDDLVDDIGRLCDECLINENDMFLAFSREDKDKIAEAINKKMSDDVYDKLISFLYKSKQVVRN